MPFAVLREAKIVADHEVFHVERVHEDLAYEGIRGDILHGLVETRAEEDVDSRGRQRLEFLPESHESRGRTVCLEEFPRRRLEAHHDRRHRALPGLSEYPRQQRLVTQVQTVEGADRHDGALLHAVERKFQRVTG